MIGGWESGLTRQPPTPTDPPCTCVRASVLSPQPDNRASPMPDWGQLVAARDGGGGGVGIRHGSLTCVSGWEGRGTLKKFKKNKKIRQPSESLLKSKKQRGRRGEEVKEKDVGNQMLLFLTPSHILYFLTPGWEVTVG